MCGLIGGQVDVRPLLAQLAHRGPDDEGAIEVDGWWLGHTRLAIQGSMPQPLTDPALTYNGELWRPDELRCQFDREWLTSSDTEVVAAAITARGVGALPMLDGMFAVAWVVDGRLHLARDPYGEVPLHHGETVDGRFVYASEIAPLLAAGAAPDSVRWVPPGSVLIVDADGSTTTHQWFDSPIPDDRTMRDLLSHGVGGRLTSDAPVALLLSGGLDSSAIASLAKVSVAYTAVHHPRSLDLKHARQVAARLGIELVEVRVPAPTVDDLRETVRRIEMPHKAQVEIGWACLHLARRMQADGVRVVLSGEGADELFASYGMAYHGIKQHGWDGYRRRVFTGQHRKNFARTNKVFMAHSVEARLPFLDPQLVANVLSWSQDEVTMGGRHPKAVLASAFESDIGTPAAFRAKAAFQTAARINKSAAEATADPAALYRSTFQSVFGVKP